MTVVLPVAIDLPPVQHRPEPEGFRLWERLVPRQLEPEDWVRFEAHVSEILTAFGLDLI